MLHRYINGNAEITLYKDGTRVITSEDGTLKLDYPLNIDIRVSERCSFGLNPATGVSVCSFCHESATTDGADADYDYLLSLLDPLPVGIELAIGANSVSTKLVEFVRTCSNNGFIVNLTVNQGHTHRMYDNLIKLIENNHIKGLGVSYRDGMRTPPKALLEYENTVVHVIAGLDNLESVLGLAEHYSKILVLGEKDFGFNKGKVKLASDSHTNWYRNVHKLFKTFKIVSFDNLALEQLNVKRFVKNWEQMYQHEYSFYINAVQKYYSPSSRSDEKTSCDEVGILEYFKQIHKFED